MSLRHNFIFFSVVMLSMLVFIAIYRLSGNFVNDVVPLQPKKRLGIRGNQGINDLCGSNETCLWKKEQDVVPIQPKKRLGIRGNQGINDLCSDDTCLWEKEQRARKAVLLDMCGAFHSQADSFFPPLSYGINKTSKRPAKMASKFRNLLVVDSLKLIYCYIPKVSCTSWKRLLLVLNGNFKSTRDTRLGQKQSHVIARHTFRILSSYSVKEAKNLLATYHKFLFVRNPFERALSAYQDKFQNDYPASKDFRRSWSERIIRSAVGSSSPGKFQRLVRSQKRTDGTINVTFSQFVRFLSAIESPSNMNEHWTQMYDLCHPCAVQYDWIGHNDHLEKESNFILAAIGANPDIRFPNYSTNPTGSSNGETLRRYYSTLTTAEIESLQKHYLLDFNLFGFDIPESIRELLDRRGRKDPK